MANNGEQATLIRTIALGILSGGRAATPLAVLAINRDNKAVAGSWQQWPIFRSDIGRGALVAAAIGELIGDKLPKTPNRISPAGLIGRAGSGALVGLALGTTGKKDLRLEGALLGAAGAIVGSFVGWGARKLAGAATHLPDPVVALAEDAAVVAGSVRALAD